MSNTSEARERLRRWVAEQPSKAAVARDLGCDSSYLSHLLAPDSTRRPGLDLAFRIEHLSETWEHGPIKAAEWLSEPPPESLPATGTDDV